MNNARMDARDTGDAEDVLLGLLFTNIQQSSTLAAWARLEGAQPDIG